MEHIKYPINIISVLLFFKKYFIYLFMRETEIEAETQAEGEAGSMQGAGRATPRTPGSRPGLKAGAEPLSHPGIPRPGS